MIDLIDASRRVLQEAGVVSAPLDVPNVMALAFEGATLIGFVITYDEPENLLARWNKDAQDLISAHQLGLRRAQSKAWNTYLVLLASGHGRQEERSCVVVQHVAGLRDRQQWPHLTTVGMSRRERTVDGQTSEEVYYFIGSRRMAARRSEMPES